MYWLSPVLALVGLAAMIVGYIFLPRAAACGWLVAFDFCSAIVLGSLGIALVGRITGGAWYEAVAPVSASTVLLVPALLIAIVPVFGSEALLFHWNAVRPGVGELWLNMPGHIARSVVLLLALSAFALWRGRWSSMLATAAGLVLYAFAFSVFAIDWVYAIAAQTMYTAFGAYLAISGLATALALAVLLSPKPAPSVARDIGGLLIAMVLGSLYLEFMDFMVAWYGDVPARIAWYAARATWPWPVLLWAALILGAFGPLFVLLASRTRFVLLPLRTVAGAILLGAFAYDAWLVVPEFGWAALGFAGAGTLLMAALGISFVGVRTRAVAAA
jgi:hypothetical protein